MLWPHGVLPSRLPEFDSPYSHHGAFPSEKDADCNPAKDRLTRSRASMFPKLNWMSSEFLPRRLRVRLPAGTLHDHVAQLDEHQPPKLTAAGSNPAVIAMSPWSNWMGTGLRNQERKLDAGSSPAGDATTR